MADEQQTQHKESSLFGITVRGWIAVIIVVTVCIMSLLRFDVKEPLYTLVISAVSFYLGSRSNTMMTQPKQNGTNGTA